MESFRSQRGHAAARAVCAGRRSELRGDHVDEIATRLLCAPEDVDIEGKDSTGYYSRVPWVRFANRQLSPNPRTGWYAVYLFAEDGTEVSLSLNQGTQVWDGAGMRSQPEPQIRRRSVWARAALGAARQSAHGSTPRSTSGTETRAGLTKLQTSWRTDTRVTPCPMDDALAADLLDMASLLQLVYRAEAQMPAPGDPAPEIVEAERASQELAGRRVPRRTGFRSTAKQRRAIELRAMAVAAEHFSDSGGKVKDVSASRSYDLEVARWTARC